MSKLRSVQMGLWALCLIIFAPLTASKAATEPLTIFAAASLKDTLEAIGKAYTASGGGDVRFSFASSSVLAKQIEAGSVADIFASADLKWMDYLATKNLIRTETRTHLLGNRLVLVAPADTALSSIELTRSAITTALGDGRIATGDTASVPAGIYAKSALQNLGLWTALEQKLAQADNVRAALAFVTRKEAPLGIVYETDARAERGVKILAFFPETSHEPIIYPFAITTTSTHAEAEKFLNFLRGKEARRLFEEAGFPVLVP